MSAPASLGGWIAEAARFGRRHVGTLALFATVFLAVQIWQIRNVDSGPLPAAALDAPLPVLSPDGSQRTSSLRHEIATLQARYPGRNIGLYIWADWCPICSTIRGTVDGVAQDHPVLTVAMQSGAPDKVARHLAAKGVAWHTMVDSGSVIPGALGFGSVPAFAVITPQGSLRWPTLGLSTSWGLRLRLLLA
jgi:hypothetical protein